MADLITKLGIKPGQSVCILDAPPAAAILIRQSCPDGVTVTERLGRGKHNLIIFWPLRRAGLRERFAQLARRIIPEGAIWAVMPKKKFAVRRGIDFAWEQLQAAGLAGDLVDNKIASVTEQDYGTRFVIRKEKRAAQV